MSLSEAEKAAMAKKVGNTASIMISSVVRLYLASPNPKAKKSDPDSVLRSFPDLSDSQWKYTNVMGALVLVMDRTLQTFLFRIYDMDAPHEMRFEFELYEDIEYKALDLQFHSFEMEDCVGGFSFCNKDEAPKFLSKVNALKPSAKDNAIDALKGQQKSGGGLGLFASFRGKEKKPVAPQVSGVVNVVHTQHIGINADGTFDLNNISPEWKALFRQAGIKKKDLANPEVAKAIISTIAASTGATVQITPQQLPNVSEAEMKQYYTPQQQREFEEYQSALAKYEADLAAYEAEQAALAAWERDNARYLEEQARKEREEAERVEREKVAATKPPLPSTTGKKGPPPVAPPRNRDAGKKQAEEKKEAPAKRKSSILKLFGMGGAEPASAPPPPNFDDDDIPPPPEDEAGQLHGATALELEVEEIRRKAQKVRESAMFESEAVRKAAMEAEAEAENMRQAAQRLRQKAEEETAQVREQAAIAKRKAEEDALAEHQQASEARTKAQQEAQRLKGEAAQARKLAQEEAEAELRAAQEAKEQARANAMRERQEAEETMSKARAEAMQEKQRAEAEREYNRRLAEIARKEELELIEQEKARIEVQKAEAQALRRKAQEEAEAAAKEAAAEREYAMQLAAFAKKEQEEKLARERENARRLAEIAAKEQEEMMEQLRLMQERTKAAKALLEEEERKADELQRQALKKRAPPIPARLPDKPPLPAQPNAPPKPPPPPTLPAIPTTAPKMTRSPSVLIGLQLGEVKLKKTEAVNDKSAPDVTGQRGRAPKTNALLGALEQGVQLKKGPGPAAKSSLPQIQEMDKKQQANIMTSLIETMNVRRGALQGDDGDGDDDDGWSD